MMQRTDRYADMIQSVRFDDMKVLFRIERIPMSAQPPSGFIAPESERIKISHRRVEERKMRKVCLPQSLAKCVFINHLRVIDFI